MDQLSHNDVLAMMKPVGRVAEVSQASGRTLRFDLDAGRPKPAMEDKRPAVYAWVIGSGSAAPEIVYLGKAGKGLPARCRQHEQGFKQKGGKGRSNGDRLGDYLARSEVELWAMWPDPVRFGTVLIPSHSAVEDWLLAALDRPPALNREAAAKARAEAIAAGTHVPKRRSAASA